MLRVSLIKLSKLLLLKFSPMLPNERWRTEMKLDMKYIKKLIGATKTCFTVFGNQDWPISLEFFLPIIPQALQDILVMLE
jgi:hypothetical protein